MMTAPILHDWPPAVNKAGNTQCCSRMYETDLGWNELGFMSQVATWMSKLMAHWGPGAAQALCGHSQGYV